MNLSKRTLIGMRLVKNERDVAMDVLRGIAIIFVVLGHAGVNDYWWNVLYFFHMPLFFFISGCFFKPLQNIRLTEYLKSLKWKRLYKPFVLYALAFLFLSPLLYEYGLTNTHLTTGKEWIKSIELILRFRTTTVDLLVQFWFLPVLFSVHALSLVVSVMVKRKWIYSFIAIIFFIIGRWCFNHGYNEPYDFSRILYLSAFYILGFCVYEYRQKYTNNVFLFLVLLIFFFVFTLFPHEVFASIPCYFFVASSGIIVSCYLSARIVDLKYISLGLSYIGKHTMVIYVYHTISIKCFELFFAKAGVIDFYTGWPGQASLDGYWWLYTIVGVCVPLLFCGIADQCKKHWPGYAS